MRDKGLPVLAHQEQALAKAGEALDQTRPHAARDLASRSRAIPGLSREAAEGNTGGAAKAMEDEQQVRLDPEKRAGRFVEQWQGMKQARASMERAGDSAGAREVAQAHGEASRAGCTATRSSNPHCVACPRAGAEAGKRAVDRRCAVVVARSWARPGSGDEPVTVRAFGYDPVCGFMQ